MDIKISIIVPVYNVEKYLVRCIESILQQTFKDFELILVDDGSPDECGAICDRYSLKDSRVRVIHKENGGLSSARNAGIDIATGKYIGFVDSDDWINKDMYHILYDLILKYNSDIVECCYKRVTEKNLIEEEKCNNKIKILSNIEVLEEMYKDGFAGSTVSWNKLYKKELFSKTRFPEGKLNEDQFTTYQLYFNSNLVVATNRVLYYYNQEGVSIMRSSFSIKKLDVIDALEEARAFYEKNKLDKIKLWNDTLYSFMLIKYYIILDNETDEYKLLKSQLRTKFKSNYKEFINNPNINKKSKVLLRIFNISPKIYKVIY